MFKSLLVKTNNLFRRSLKDNIIFLHVPKCGGMSVDYAIRRHYRKKDRLVTINASASTNAANLISQINFPYGTSDDYPILKLRENLLLYYMSQNMKYISGHFGFSEIGYRKFLGGYTFITILRDPVKRWISLYFFNRYKKERHCKIEEDITTFVQSEFGKSQGYEYVKFLGGADNDRDYVSQQAIDRAKKNVDKFDIIGCLEYPEIFITKFENKFGIRLRIEKKNKNPKPESFRESIITEEIEEKIKEICKPDLEVYQYAIEKFVKAND